MCGFAGVVHWDGGSVAPEELGRMVGALRHRGPDEACAVLPCPGVGLGHARLKVIDVSEAAQQPMASEDGSVWLTYNGEVYNFQALRQELEAFGARFHSQSDTEVVLRAYERWGADAIARLDGMFALACWDARRRELLLARDRTGKKPLFYWTDGRCVAFASEIKALLPHAHVPCAVDDAVLPFLLTFGYPPEGSTSYQGIRQLPPASLMRVRAGDPAPAPASYWDLDLTSAAPVPPIRTAAAEVRRRLMQAVERRLVADVPLGAFLSGGVDSTIIVGLMTERLAGRRVKTFSIGFSGDARYDETRYARLAGARYRTEHTAFTVSPQPFDLLERLVWHHDQPFGDSSAVPTFLLSQLAREHVTVALTGDGGDELFAGYARFAAALWAERIPAGFRRALHGLVSRLPSGHERSLTARLNRFLAVAQHPFAERYTRWTAYFQDADRWLRTGGAAGSLLTGHPAIARRWAHASRWPRLAQLLYVNFKEYLPHDLHVKTDRCSMAHGLEARSPFLDTSLIEYVAGLPDAYKLRGWTTKRLLRLACQDLLPPAIARRGKMGFGVPLAAWFRRQWRDPLRAYVDAPDARLSRYLKPGPVRELIDAHMAGRVNAGNQLWLLLTVEMWLRQLERPRHGAAPQAPVRWLSAARVSTASAA